MYSRALDCIIKMQQLHVQGWCTMYTESLRSFRRFFMTLHARKRFYRWMSTAITWTMVVRGLDH